MKKKAEPMDKFLASEIKKIDIDKWCEGVASRKDPGQEYVITWISKNAKWFRESWNESCCKRCIKWKECGYEVKKECENFIKDLDVSYVNDKVCYIECVCHSLTHGMSIYYDDETKSFFLQYKVQRMPREMTFEKYNVTSRKDRIKYFFTFTWWKIRQWCKHVWLAIKGKPLTFNAYIEIGPDEAYRISEFLKDKLPV